MFGENIRWAVAPKRFIEIWSHQGFLFRFCEDGSPSVMSDLRGFVCVRRKLAHLEFPTHLTVRNRKIAECRCYKVRMCPPGKLRVNALSFVGEVSFVTSETFITSVSGQHNFDTAPCKAAQEEGWDSGCIRKRFAVRSDN